MQTLIIGCGYLGQRVAETWLAAGHQVAALTRSTERAEQFRARGLTPRVGDVMRPDSLADFPVADVLLYAVGLDRGSGYSQRQVYVDGLANVLRQAQGHVGRIVYVSSTSVYGQSDGEWIDETSPCEPTRENGQVCLEAEQQVQASGIPWTILRLSGIYGPGRLIGRLDALLRQQPLTANPDAWLNLIHVADASRAVVACDTSHQGETFLVSDDQPLRRADFYGTLAARIGAPDPVFTPGEPEALGKRCRNAKLKTALLPTLSYPTVATGLTDALPG